MKFLKKLNEYDYLIQPQSVHTMSALNVLIWINFDLPKIISIDFIKWWCPRTESNRGPIDYKSIAPISPFRPRRWRGKIVNDKLKITITNLNPSKRPISAVADNLEVRNAKSIVIKTNNKIKFNLLYDKNRSLQKKIKIEQIRKETS